MVAVAETRTEMKITVEIPTALRRFTDGVQTIECSSATLPDLLGEIEQRFPAIVKHLRDDSGQVRRFSIFTSTRRTFASSAATNTSFVRRSCLGGALDCGRVTGTCLRMSRMRHSGRQRLSLVNSILTNSATDLIYKGNDKLRFKGIMIITRTPKCTRAARTPLGAKDMPA